LLSSALSSFTSPLWAYSICAAIFVMAAGRLFGAATQISPSCQYHQTLNENAGDKPAPLPAAPVDSRTINSKAAEGGHDDGLAMSPIRAVNAVAASCGCRPVQLGKHSASLCADKGLPACCAKDEARRIPTNFAKLPGLYRRHLPKAPKSVGRHREPLAHSGSVDVGEGVDHVKGVRARKTSTRYWIAR
jgi:hypothetical protein